MADITTLGQLISFMRTSCRTIRLNDDEFRFDPKSGNLEYDLGDGINNARMTPDAIKSVCSVFKAPGAWIAKQRPELVGYLLDDLLMHYRGEDLELAFEVVADDQDPSVQIVSNVYDTSSRWGITETLEDVAKVVPESWAVIQPDVSGDHVSIYVYDPDDQGVQTSPDSQTYHVGTHISYDLVKGKKITVNTALINAVDETAIDLSFDGTGRISSDNTKGGISEVIRERRGESDKALSDFYFSKDNVIDDIEHMIDTYARQCGLGVRLTERVKTDLAGSSGFTALELADMISRSEMGVKTEGDAAKIALLAGCAFIAHDPHRCPRCHQEVDDSVPDSSVDAQ